VLETTRRHAVAARHAVRPDWMELALEEYRALRGEVLTTMQTQDGGLRFGVAALGIVSAAGFAVWKDTAAAALIFLVVIPLVTVVVLIVWIGEVTRMMRAGRHIARLEELFCKRIDDLPRPVMRWETNLRDPQSDITDWERHYSWSYHAIVVMFWLIGIASIGAGLYRGLWGEDPLGHAFAVAAAAGVVSGLSVVALVLLLKHLAKVCAMERT
jgi:hypothetical protein